MRIRDLVIVGCVVATSTLGFGQDRIDRSTDQPRGHFSSSVDLVVLHATVTDRRGNFVLGLPQDAFIVYEDNRPQTLSFFRERSAPVTVGLLIDGSGSMIENRNYVAAAAEAFAEASRPEDEFFAMAFNDFPLPLMPAENPFTSEPSVLREVLAAGLETRGRTALYDAVRAALDKLAAGSRDRKVLIVVSDGADNASSSTFEQMLRKAQSSNAVIYTVAVVDRLPGERNPKLLRRIAAATGGLAFEPSRIEHVDDALKAIGVDVRNSYTLAYVPWNTARDGHVRRLRVSVRGPEGRPLKVRTRTEYIAAPDRNFKDGE
jgi:VWFA-related protein